jgi:glycosyltransferase involved in cell wall biosynthesis
VKALFLAHAYPRTVGDPVGSFILRLAVALREQGVGVVVVAPSAPGLAATDEIEGIPVERYRYASASAETLAYTGTMSAQVRGSWAGRAALAALLAAGSARALTAARRHRVNLVHGHWWFPGGLMGAGVSRLLGLPLITTSHGSDLRLARQVPRATVLLRATVRRSASFTTVSRWLATELESLVPGSSPVVAPMPIAPGLFEPAAERARDRLLFVGKLSEQKGLHHLLEALARMRARPSLEVVGAGRVDDVHLRSMARELGLDDRITWRPLLPQAELAVLYREATALVIPAVEEGLGLTAVEALLSETPVVAFASGGVTDAVVHEETGLLVRPGDAAALAAALDDLMTRPDRGAALGRAGRRRVLNTFSMEAVGKRYAELYRAALVGPRR